MRCNNCGIELSAIKDNFSLMVEDYKVNKSTHVCDTNLVELHKINESNAIREVVKDVKAKQLKLEKPKILNAEILNIHMDAPTKLNP